MIKTTETYKNRDTDEGMSMQYPQKQLPDALSPKTVVVRRQARV